MSVLLNTLKITDNITLTSHDKNSKKSNSFDNNFGRFHAIATKALLACTTLGAGAHYFMNSDSYSYGEMVQLMMLVTSLAALVKLTTSTETEAPVNKEVVKKHRKKSEPRETAVEDIVAKLAKPIENKSTKHKPSEVEKIMDDWCVVEWGN